MVPQSFVPVVVVKEVIITWVSRNIYLEWVCFMFYFLVLIQLDPDEEFSALGTWWMKVSKVFPLCKDNRFNVSDHEHLAPLPSESIWPDLGWCTILAALRHLWSLRDT